jgi:hypothetical protein
MSIDRHAEALERFKVAKEAEAAYRENAAEDVEFYNGDQWPATVDRDGRPKLTINTLPPFVKQVTNEQRKDRPQIKVVPFDSGSDVKTADMITGLIRHIQANSRTKAAFNTAYEQAVIKGRGYIRVDVDYLNEWAFDQDIFINRIKNAESVYFDPDCNELDYSDAEWAFVMYEMTREEYKSKYPDGSGADIDMAALSKVQADWFTSEKIMLAEYFSFERRTETLLQLANGLRCLKSQYQQILDAAPVGSGEMLAVVAERETEIKVLKWRLMNGVDFDDEKDMLGRFIPIIPVIGEEVNVNGDTNLKGIVRDAKDAQRQFNYWKSTAVEMLALAPKAPFIGYRGQFAGDAVKWKTLNQKAYPYIEVDPITKDGVLLPLPSRQVGDFFPAGAMQLAMASADDVKRTTGIWNAALGMDGMEKSGKAILARQQEGDTATYNFVDNFAIALEQVGRVIVDLIPKVYTTEKVVRILGEDGVEDIVRLTKGPGNPDRKLFNLETGSYDVVVNVGPGFATRRQQAAESMTEFSRFYPQYAEPVMDLIAKNMDWPGADEFAKRFQAIIQQKFPGLIQMDGKQISPAQVAALVQQNNQLQQAMQQAAEELKSRREEQQVKLIMNKNDNDVKWAIANLQAKGKADETTVKANSDMISKRIDSATRLQAEQIKSATAITTGAMTKKVDIE